MLISSKIPKKYDVYILNGSKHVAHRMEIIKVFVTEEIVILEQILELIISSYNYTFQAL